MLELLENLHDQFYRIDGCFRVITFCAGNKQHLSKQLEDKISDDELAEEVLFDKENNYLLTGSNLEVAVLMSALGRIELFVQLVDIQEILMTIKYYMPPSPAAKCTTFHPQ